MQRLEVSCAVRPTYVARRQRVKDTGKPRKTYVEVEKFYVVLPTTALTNLRNLAKVITTSFLRLTQ
jgi:hypothetical protein